MENATSEGIMDLLIEGLDSNSMNRIVEEFHRASGGYNFNEFRKYLSCNGITVIDVEQVEIFFTDEGR
jgi:hypothetical protein